MTIAKCIVNSAPQLRVENAFPSYFRILHPHNIFNLEAANGKGRRWSICTCLAVCAQYQLLELTIMTASLPDEILIKIIEQIIPGPTRANTRERNILPLQVANKQWCRVATEILYRSVRIVSPGMLNRFLHTVLHYPSYSALVRELEIGHMAFIRYPPTTGPYTHTYDEKLIQAIQKHQIKAVARHFHTTKVLVLLCILHKLERLKLEPNEYLMDKFAAVDGHASRKLHVLDVDLRNRPTDEYPVKILYPFFWVRTIKQLVLRNVNQIPWEYDDYSCQPSEERLGTSTIEKLVIPGAHMVSGTLVRLLRFPRELKEFAYQDDGPPPGTIYSFPVIQPALNQVAHTLIVLCIAWCFVGPFTDDHISLDLRGFPRLKKVAISLELLLGCYPEDNIRLQQKLPVSLEVLYPRMATSWLRAGSRWNDESYVAAVRDLIACKDEQLFPRLGVICMGNKDHLTSLRGLAQTKGVILEWEAYPKSFPFE